MAVIQKHTYEYSRVGYRFAVRIEAKRTQDTRWQRVYRAGSRGRIRRLDGLVVCGS